MCSACLTQNPNGDSTTVFVDSTNQNGGNVDPKSRLVMAHVGNV